MPSKVATRLALRHRAKLFDCLRHSAALLLAGALLLLLTFGPMFLGWWDTVTPGALAIAICVPFALSVLIMFPLEFVGYLALYLDHDLKEIPYPGWRFGHALYRESGRLDALAAEAGFLPLSEFESPDVLETGAEPVWRRPEAALSTVEYLIDRTDPGSAVHSDLLHVRTALSLARERGARFYLLLLTLAGVTNAELEARRRRSGPNGP